MSCKMQYFVLAVMFATALVQPLKAQQQTACVPKAMRPIIDGESHHHHHLHEHGLQPIIWYHVGDLSSHARYLP
jgi:hypothetical protein